MILTGHGKHSQQAVVPAAGKIAATAADAIPTVTVIIAIIANSNNSNSDKTQLILFKKPCKPIPDDSYLTLDNCIIKPEKTVKLLGVTLDQHLTFGTNNDNIVNKCQGLLGILAKATSYLPKELLKLLYTALIRSHMEYCSSMFYSAAKTHLKKLDVIQRKAAHIIYEVPRGAHADILLLFLKLDELGDKREAHLVKLIKSFLSGKCHPAMPSMTEVCCGKTLRVSQSRSTVGTRRPSVFGANIYNQYLGFSSDSDEADTLLSQS